MTESSGRAIIAPNFHTPRLDAFFNLFQVAGRNTAVYIQAYGG